MRLFVLALSLNLLAPIRGQQAIQFDTVRFGPVSYAIGYSVFEVDSVYRVFNLQKFSGTSFQDLVVSAFDVGGGIVNEVHNVTYSADWIGSSSPVSPVDSGYVSGVARFGSGPLDSLFLFRFDGNGDTLWTKFIDADTTFLMRGTAVTTTGDVLLAGLHEYPEEAYVYHLDSAGNVKGYHGYAGFDGEDVVDGKDGKWYVCGLGNQTNNYGRGVVVRSDTNGTELWRRTLTDAAPGWYKSVIALHDSSILCLGVGSPDQQAYGNFALAIKYDPTGNMVWRRDLYESESPSWPSWFHAGYEAADRTLVLAGWYRSFAQRDQGLIVKLTADGDTVWHRFYSHYPGAAYGKDQIFWDVKPTSDGGMVLTGETNSDAYPYAQLWLLKLDSLGCLVPGCGSVGVEEYTDLFNGKLNVSPNPASDRISIALDLTEGVEVSGQLRAVLLDASGRLALEQPVQQNLNQLRTTVDVGALPAGTYYVHVRDAKRWLAGSKLVVQ
jgi:Secretion system C-terminal sorting domain